MAESEVKYRDELAEKGLIPSWYYEHKGDNIIHFIQDIYHIIKDVFENNEGFLQNIKLIIDKLFHNQKAEIKSIDSDEVRKNGFEKA